MFFTIKTPPRNLRKNKIASKYTLVGDNVSNEALLCGGSITYGDCKSQADRGNPACFCWRILDFDKKLQQPLPIVCVSGLSLLLHTFYGDDGILTPGFGDAGLRLRDRCTARQ